MPTYEIKSFTGLSDYEDKGHPGAFKFGTNLDVRKAIDSLTCKQDLIDIGLHDSRSPSASQSPSVSVSFSPSLSPSASASPTPSPSASQSPSVSVSLSPSVTASSSISPSPSGFDLSTTVFQDLVLWWVKATDGYLYGFGNTGYIYRIDSSFFVQIVYKDAYGKIKGAEEAYSSNGHRYLTWATDTRLNIIDISSLANWNNANALTGWPKQNLQSVDWHTMKQVAGDTLIANGEFLAFIGYDLSYTNEALDLIPGNLAKTIVERNGQAVIGTSLKSDPSRGVNAAIDAEVQLAQIGNDGDIVFSDGINTQPVKRFPGGGIVNPGGVCNEIEQVGFFTWETTALSWISKQEVGNLSLWAVYDADSGRGGIYSYGRTNKNKPFVLNLDYQFDADQLGALTNYQGTVLVSYQDGNSFGVKRVDSGTKAEATYEGLDFKAPVKQPVNITEWKTAELWCAPLPDGCWIEFWYRMNKTGDFVRAYLADGTAQFQTANEKKAVFFIQEEGEIFEPRVVLHPYANTSPEVHRLRVNFQ